MESNVSVFVCFVFLYELNQHLEWLHCLEWISIRGKSSEIAIHNWFNSKSYLEQCIVVIMVTIHCIDIIYHADWKGMLYMGMLLLNNSKWHFDWCA